MSLTVGTNSWATVAEADDYLTDRIGATTWFALSETSTPGADSKESMLVSAFWWLSNSPDLELSASLASSAVKVGQTEAALFLLAHYHELDERRAAMHTGVTDFEYSERKESLDLSKLSIPDYITAGLSEYTTRSAMPVLKGQYDE